MRSGKEGGQNVRTRSAARPAAASGGWKLCSMRRGALHLTRMHRPRSRLWDFPFLLECTQMKPSPRRYPMLLTHGAAILVGCLVGKILVGGATSTVPPYQNTTRPTARPSAMEISAAWLDESLREVRAENAPAETTQQAPLTIPELLKKCREEADAERKECNDRVDAIVKESARYANEPDPLAAIRRNMHAGDSENDHSLAIFQAWLDKDLETALAELGRNWRLSQDTDIPLLLERKLGRDWLKRQIEGDRTPYRLRTGLTGSLGRNLAWEGDLEGLLKQYDSISDPALKLRLIDSFSWSWPLDDPLLTARLLRQGSESARDGLMDRLTPPVELVSQSGSFPVGPASPPTCATWEWFDVLHAELNPGSRLAEPDGPAIPEKGVTEKFLFEATSFDEAVSLGLKAGDTHEAAVKKALEIQVGGAMSEGTDLEELYGEGRITRSEFLAELTRRIPGAEAFPEALEREAWRRTSMTSDAKQVRAWAAELSKQGEGSELLLDAVPSTNPYEDPRIPMRLSRYQIFTAELPEGPVLSKIRQREAQAWSRWNAVSPSRAGAWRDSLAADDRLREAIGEEEEQERERKGTP